MDGMFSQCSNLKEIKFSDNFNTSNVNDMGRMFYNCSKLEDLDLSEFDISKIYDMTYMFDNCDSLNKVIVSKDEDTQNKILTQLKEKGANWEVSVKEGKVILTKKQ